MRSAPGPGLSVWRSGRALRACLALALGMLANAVAVGTPGAVPLLLGVVVPTRFANRRQPGWALVSGLLVGAATGDPLLTVFCLWLAVLSVLLARQALGRRLLLAPLLALPLAAWVLWRAPPLAPWPVGLGLLALNALLAQFASHLLFDLPEAARRRRLPTLRSLLTSRFTAALAPGLFAGLLLAGQWYWAGQLNDSRDKTQLSHAQIGTYVEEHVGEHLRAVAQAADDASASGHTPALQGLRRRLSGFLTLLVTDDQGRLLDFHAPGAPSAVDPVDDRDYFRVPRESGKPFVSGVFRGRGFGTHALVAVSAPYFDAEGRFLGVVEGSLSLQAMQERMAQMAQSGGIEVVLRDRQGAVIASTLPGHPLAAPLADARLAPAVDRHPLPLNAGRDHLLVESRLPGLDWQLTGIRPLAPIASQQTLGHLLLGLLCLGGLALIHWLVARFVRSLSGPLDQLLAHVRNINLERPASLRPVALEARFAELAELRQDFNAMLRRLGELDTGLRAALRAQAQLNHELEQRVARRTEDLREALTKARQLADAKSSFLANMSHELRTPLTSILGYAELAMEPDAADATQREALQTIRRQGEHLLAVVNDVLDAGRIESGSLRVESTPIGLAELLSDLESTFAERARGRGIRLQVRADEDLPPALIADPLRLRQVLINLLGNALKFTREGSVELRARRCCGALALVVRDTGIGLDADARSRLFLPFSQADLSTTRRFGGSGLGLFISRRLSEAMGGRLSLHSRPGRGSRFSVLFPLALGAFAAPSALPPSSRDSSVPQLQGRVLIADDVEDLRRLVVAMVCACGAEVRDCANGQEALTLSAEWSPELILMDMHMPVMDGMQATATLRRQGLQMPIVALTADVLAEDRRRFLDAGCDAVLHKPIRREALYALLRRHLRPAAATASAEVPLGGAFRELSQRYAARLAGEADELQPLAAPAHREALLQRLHTLKGSAGTFGFSEVSSLAAELEARLKADSAAPTVGDQPLVGRLLASMREAPARVCADGGTPASGGTLGG